MPFAHGLNAIRWRVTEHPMLLTPAVATQTQQASRWCWLATAASVDAHYGGTATQCGLADALLHRSGCCSHPDPCNRAGVVEAALRQVGHHQCTTTLYDPPEVAALQTALAQGRPPVAQFRFRGRGEHVVLLAAHGVDVAGEPFIRVGDPALGWNPTDLVWAHARYYRGGVSWKHVCWTR